MIILININIDINTNINIQLVMNTFTIIGDYMIRNNYNRPRPARLRATSWRWRRGAPEITTPTPTTEPPLWHIYHPTTEPPVWLLSPNQVWHVYHPTPLNYHPHYRAPSMTYFEGSVRPICTHRPRIYVIPPATNGVRMGQNGVSTNGVTADFNLFDRGTFWGTPANLLLSSQKCQGVPLFPIRRNSLLAHDQRPVGLRMGMTPEYCSHY